MGPCRVRGQRREGGFGMIQVTERASTKLQSLMAEAASERKVDDLALRVFVRGQCGCGKAHYGMGLDNQVREGDQAVDVQGVMILVDSESAPLVQGTELDYVEDLMQQGFTLKNPAAAGCGCGH